VETRDRTVWYPSITIGYSDSEDRLWVRLSADGAEAMLWMTRRLVAGLLRSGFDMLGGGKATAALTERHHEVMAEASEEPRTKAPPRAAGNATVQQLGLLHSVDISVDANRMSLAFRGNGQPAGFACDKVQAHKLLQALWDRQSGAGWGLDAPWALPAHAAVLGEP
jgi:hypothetical protein